MVERVNLLRGDVAGNWRTNPDILTHGLDSHGRRLLATAGKPNSPSLETLTAFATSQVEATTIGSPTSILIPNGLVGVTPSIRVTIAVGTDTGGGGSLSPAVLIATRRTEAEHWIDLNPAGRPTGTICVWVAEVVGEALLLPLSREPQDGSATRR